METFEEVELNYFSTQMKQYGHDEEYFQAPLTQTIKDAFAAHDLVPISDNLGILKVNVPNGIIYIHSLKDEWFYIQISNNGNQESRYFKCDQRDGLIDCLNQIL